MPRALVTIGTVALAFGILCSVGPAALAAQKGKARSNLATGDIVLLEQAFGSTARLQRKARGPAARRVKYFNTLKKVVRDY